MMPNRADQRMKNTTVDSCVQQSLAIPACLPQAENVTIQPGLVHYAFLPVWLFPQSIMARIISLH
jgi:hypothetical protein